jgi:hypothetical protein
VQRGMQLRSLNEAIPSTPCLMQTNNEPITLIPTRPPQREGIAYIDFLYIETYQQERQPHPKSAVPHGIRTTPSATGNRKRRTIRRCRSRLRRRRRWFPSSRLLPPQQCDESRPAHPPLVGPAIPHNLRITDCVGWRPPLGNDVGADVGQRRR